jgi:hypothetical protein
MEKWTPLRFCPLFLAIRMLYPEGRQTNLQKICCVINSEIHMYERPLAELNPDGSKTYYPVSQEIQLMILFTE